MKGLFITIEGTDGAGKSTQIELLKKFLENKGYDVVETREPGGTPIGEKIRDLLLDIENKNMSNETEALLYAAARAQHVYEKIKPEIENGKIIICDRFVDSSLAYQAYARGICENMIKDINKYAVLGIEPDITLFLCLEPKKGISRKKNAAQLDRIEQEKIDFHNKVYDGYIKIYNENKSRIKCIDADKSIEEVHKQIITEVQKVLENL